MILSRRWATHCHITASSVLLETLIPRVLRRYQGEVPALIQQPFMSSIVHRVVKSVEPIDSAGFIHVKLLKFS